MGPTIASFESNHIIYLSPSFPLGNVKRELDGAFHILNSVTCCQGAEVPLEKSSC